MTNLESCIAEINQQINPVLTAFFASGDSLQEAVNLIKDRVANENEIRAIRLYITSDYTNTLQGWTSAELERLKSELMSISTALEEVIIKRPFNWQVEFPHVFDPRLPESQRGFAAIIGNPPYFSVDATFGRGASELLWLKTIYTDIYTDKTDILFYFLRWSYELLKESGTLSFIVSRAFIQGDKSKNLRKFLSQCTKITNLLDFLGHQVFSAGIATCVIQFQKEIPTIELVSVRIRNNFLRRYLLARLIYLIEFDPDFRRKQKLTRDVSNLLTAAFDALKMYQFDTDRINNLRVLEVIEQRVQQETGRSDLENILLRQGEIQAQIDRIAYKLYGVVEYQEVIEQSLKIVL